jgi:hypothetical protein
MLVANGATHNVAIRGSVQKELEKAASAEQRAGLTDIVTRYAKGGPSNIPRSKYNGQEGWFPSDKAPGKIRLEAFKPWQLRAYGFCRQFNGRPTFFITGVDASKKQNKARPNILNAAGAEAVKVNDLLK